MPRASAPGARLMVSVKPRLSQQLLPDGGRQEGIIRPEVGVGETPPTFGQAERQVQPARGPDALGQHEETTRG